MSLRIKPKIFISYSRADKLYVDLFSKTLKEEFGENSFWYDKELGKNQGQKWWEVIKQKIHSCNIFIYLISNESWKSTWCQKELALAKEAEKHIIYIITRRLVVHQEGS
jgi:hypothetical protein